MKQREYESDGVKKQNYYVDADITAVSVRWGHARTQKTIEWMASSSSKEAVVAALGATDITDAPPF